MAILICRCFNKTNAGEITCFHSRKEVIDVVLMIGRPIVSNLCD